jgi:NADH-quinone oxidoreductase subunit F
MARRRARHTVLFADAENRDLTRISEYEQVGGYESLKKAVGMERQAVLDELLAANVRGRGGAGFPMGRKASFLPKPDESAKPIYLVANADESEPGTFKDREIMARVPHMFVEGIVIACHAIGASAAFVYIRGEYLTEFEILRDALEQARRAGLVGANILGTGWSLPVVLHRGAGAYICGEETGMLESLEGKRGQPRTKPPFPAISGVYASPTLINNVETLRRSRRSSRWAAPRTRSSASRTPRARASSRSPATSCGAGTTSSSSGRACASSSMTSAGDSRTDVS